MESQHQISASDKSMSENEGIELQVRISSDTLISERNDSGSVTEHLQEIKSTLEECGSKPKNDKNISSTETSNVVAEIKSESFLDESGNVSAEKSDSSCLLTESNNTTAEVKSEAVRGESRNASVEKSDSVSLSTELSNMPAYEEKSDTLLIDFGDISQENDLPQVTSSRVLAHEEKLETTSNETGFSNSSLNNKDLSHAEGLASVNRLTQQSSDGGNALQYTEETSETPNPGAEGEVSKVESLRSICMKINVPDLGNVQVIADSILKKGETHGNEEAISCDKLQTSTRASETAGYESAASKNSACDVETTDSKSNKINTADDSENTNEEKVMNEQPRKPARVADIACKNSEVITKNAAGENVDDKNSAVTIGAVGGNVTEKHSDTAAKDEVSHLKLDEDITNDQLPDAETVVGENVSNETLDVGPSESEICSAATGDYGDRRAFFYISSSSVPGMGKEWEWPSVSSDHNYQRPSRRMERRRNASESRTCLGTQRCHYIILAVGILGVILGCLTYHLQDYGIGPKVLQPIGASAAFLSFVVCAFSSVYLTYLSYYTQGRSSRDYHPLDLSNPVASMLIDTVPQAHNSDPRFYFTESAAATFQQVFRETQSADALDRRGYSWQQTDIKRPFDQPGPSGYDPDSKRFKMDPTTRQREAYEMKSMGRISEEDQSRDRNFSQASSCSHYTLADQDHNANSSGESENGEKTPLLPKK